MFNFNMGPTTLKNIANMNPNSVTGNTALKIRSKDLTNGPNSLDLLRKTLQSSINSDIDRVIGAALETYFVPAIRNIQENLGIESISEENIREVCRSMLEDAKLLYMPPKRFTTEKSVCFDATTLINARIPSMKVQETWNRKRKFCCAECPIPDKMQPKTIADRTLFILSTRVNKVLGNSGIQVFESGLFRYCADKMDREWLIRSKLHLPSNTGEVYFMILEEICGFLKKDSHKNNPNVLWHELKGFEAPEFILKKMRLR